MSSYSTVLRSSSDCVHFIYGDQDEEDDRSIANELTKRGIVCAYIDYQGIAHDGDAHIANAIARVLRLQHHPYGARESRYQPERWVPFLDDLITLSHGSSGLVIIIDNADIFLTANSREMFELIETFLIQFHHWLEGKKPCHLCFQMTKNTLVESVFARP